MSDSNSSKRFKYGVTGPRNSPYEEGVGTSGHFLNAEVGYRNHGISAKVGEYEFGSSFHSNGFRLFGGFSPFSVGYSSPQGNFKPSLSVGWGGGFGVEDDPVRKSTTFSVYPSRGKAGADFTVSHESLDSFSHHFSALSKFGE